MMSGAGEKGNRGLNEIYLQVCLGRAAIAVNSQIVNDGLVFQAHSGAGSLFVLLVMSVCVHVVLYIAMSMSCLGNK